MNHYVKEVKNLRDNSNCLLEGMGGVECKSNGTHKREKNHIISKSSYLKRIADKKRVMAFNWEERDYYKSNGKLSERNIKNTNVYRVLCGEHDKQLFNEIENGKIFEESNCKQLFQFAFRAFIFYYDLSQVRADKTFDNLVSQLFNYVARGHLINDKKDLECYINLYKSENWAGVKHVIIKLKRKIHFVSCFYSTRNITINVFPEGEDAIILLSYLANKPKSIENYCKKLANYAIGKEEKFIAYVNKHIISTDPNIAINPIFWGNLSEKEKKSFYKCAHWFKRNSHNTLWILLKIVMFKFFSCKCNLFY